MLGLVLIYFLGKYFYDLADEYDKNKWGFAILGVVSYYVGSFISAFLIVIVLEVSSPGAVDTINEHLLGLMAVPFGLLAAWILYKVLEKRFRNEYEAIKSNPNSDILDDDFL